MTLKDYPLIYERLNSEPPDKMKVTYYLRKLRFINKRKK
jgi:hypothetical protein